MRLTAEDEEFRSQVRGWLEQNLSGDGWPANYGGRDATLAQQVIFHEEYARSGAPASMLAGCQAYELDDWQRLYLFSRADTIYGGSQEIRLGIVAERALALPRQPRP